MCICCFLGPLVHMVANTNVTLEEISRGKSIHVQDKDVGPLQLAVVFKKLSQEKFMVFYPKPIKTQFFLQEFTLATT